MPTKKPRFMVTVSDEMHEQIENYRFENRCRSQTDAINQIIERGLEALNASFPVQQETTIMGVLEKNESELLGIFRGLNENGKTNLMKQARYLNADPDMKKDGASNDATA